MIYTLTVNPALDFIVNVDNLISGTVNRAVSDNMRFGGKGINVSYILTQLGVENTALGFLGGESGAWLRRLMSENDISEDFIDLPDIETRINIKLRGTEDTEINTAGFCPTLREVGMIAEKLKSAKKGDTLVISGSIPGETGGDMYEYVIRQAKRRNLRFILDVPGSMLSSLCSFGPFLVKPNLTELSDAVGRKVGTDRKSVLEAANELIKAGAENVLVSLGEHGAMLIGKEGVLSIGAYTLDAVSGTTGAGDAMVAGFICGYDKGREYALKLAVAAAGATVSIEGLAEHDSIIELLSRMEDPVTLD